MDVVVLSTLPRYMVQGIKGKLKNAEFTKDEKFGLSIPTEMEDAKTIQSMLE